MTSTSDLAPSATGLAQVVAACCDAAIEIGERIEAAALTGGLDRTVGTNSGGDLQKELDLVADGIVEHHLRTAGVAVVASEERDGTDVLTPGGRFAVAFDPLDGSNNLSFNAPVGFIFSIREAVPDSAETFLRPGTEQVAAGAVLFGPATVLALTTGNGTDLFVLDRAERRFVPTARGVRLAAGTPEYAINASNARHWTPAVQGYVDDLLAGADGPRACDFNMRWVGALVSDAVRILCRGGIYLYPGDQRAGYRRGRLRLLYEAHPVAFLIEQAGGSATDGERRILDLSPASLHERTPLVFGSTDKVERFGRALRAAPYSAEQAPLFASRGLFRSER